MLELAIGLAVLVLLGGAFYLRRTMPWPFVHAGRKYRRMPDGSFQDSEGRVVEDPALIPLLTAEYEAAKYGRRDMSDLSID